jgi:hypothetical protein
MTAGLDLVPALRAAFLAGLCDTVPERAPDAALDTTLE